MGNDGARLEESNGIEKAEPSYPCTAAARDRRIRLMTFRNYRGFYHLTDTWPLSKNLKISRVKVLQPFSFRPGSTYPAMDSPRSPPPPPPPPHICPLRAAFYRRRRRHLLTELLLLLHLLFLFSLSFLPSSLMKVPRYLAIYALLSPAAAAAVGIACAVLLLLASTKCVFSLHSQPCNINCIQTSLCSVVFGKLATLAPSRSFVCLRRRHPHMVQNEYLEARSRNKEAQTFLSSGEFHRPSLFILLSY